MNPWSEYPFVRILVAWLAGAACCLFAGLHFPDYVFFILMASACLVQIVSKSKTFRLYQYSAVLGAFFQMVIFVFGNIYMHHRIDLNDPQQFTHRTATADFLEVQVAAPPVEKKHSYKVNVQVLACVDSGLFTSCFGKSIIYLQKTTEAAKLQYGDVLMVKNVFHPVAAPANPDAFDYRRYLSFKEVYATAFLREDAWKTVPEKMANPFLALTFQLSASAVNTIQKFIPDSSAAGVVQALLVGYRDNMDPQTMQSYKTAGVVHVLAVSGLHVGILFALLHQLLFFLNRKKHGKVVQAVLILGTIWTFALVTGMSGSVIRAATMFSFITVGKNIRRPVSLYNILGASAMVILLFEPFLMLDAGFQLSYLAVFGIGSLSNYINQWLPRENKIVDYVWKLTAMSLAAQIATLPVTIYYFHQFPVYFLLANLLVIPVAGIVLHLGFALLLLHAMPFLGVFLGHMVGALAQLMNQFILNFTLLPFSTVKVAAISLQQMLLLSMVMILLIRYFLSKRKFFLLGSLACLAIFMGADCYHYCRAFRQNSVTVFAFNTSGCIEFRTANTAQLYRYEGNLNTADSSYFLQHCRLNRIHPYVQPPENAITQRELRLTQVNDCALFQFYSYRLAVVKKEFSNAPVHHKIDLDALLISGNPPIGLKDLLFDFDPKTIIFDGTNKRYQVKKWKAEAAQLKIKTHDLHDDGAFVLAL